MLGTESEDVPGEESLELVFPAGRGGFAVVPGRLIPIVRGCVAGPMLPNLMARRAAKCFSTSIFLIKVIAAPIVLPGSTAAFRAAVDSRSY